MADFCQQCSIETWGEDTKDLAGISSADDTAAELFPVLLCESCGPVQVDHTGRRIHDPGLAAASTESQQPVPVADGLVKETNEDTGEVTYIPAGCLLPEPPEPTEKERALTRFEGLCWRYKDLQKPMSPEKRAAWDQEVDQAEKAAFRAGAVEEDIADVIEDVFL